jgi:hypothetical protein
VEVAGPLGAAVGLAVASGFSLYGAVFVSGLAIRMGWVHLVPAWASLGVLAENGLMAGAVWIALAHQLVALGVGLAVVAGAALLTVWLARRDIGVLGRLRRERRTRPRGVAGKA